ncbi:MAG TPA: glycosyltransferase family 1 protein [Acidocella sp.]|nr:glycosyltransferase family 1 protein [Acidocella sp.]
MEPLYINGRFATQNLSGVQRFAREIAAALLRITPDAQLLVPAGGTALQPGARETGHLQGQAWEQRELPYAARDGFLVNLGNTAPLLGRRQLVVIHDAGVFSTPNAYSWKFRSWYKFMQAWLVRRKVPIVTVSEFSRQELIRHLHVSAAQVAVMTEGADHALRMKPDTGILQKHGLGHGEFVLAVGTLSAHKNLKALDALARHLASRNIPLIIAGNLGGAAFQTDGATGLPQPARYIGRVTDEELKALYEHAGCFVFPSRYEGFGLPAVEAMACFCPVVAADIPALRETCGAAAHYADPTRPEEIAARALEILDDPALNARLRQAGATRTQAMTWDRAAAMLTTIIARYRTPAP